MQMDLWIAPVVFCQDIREPVLGKIHGNPGVEGAADLVLHGVQPLAHPLHLIRCRSAAFQDQFPRRSKTDALPGPDDDRLVQLLFDGLDPLG